MPGNEYVKWLFFLVLSLWYTCYVTIVRFGKCCCMCRWLLVFLCLMDILFILRLPSVKLFPLLYQIIPGVFPPSLYNFVLVLLWLQLTVWGRAMNILWFHFLFMCNNDQLICIIMLIFCLLCVSLIFDVIEYI